MPSTIMSGGVVMKDPSDQRIFVMDWGQQNLPAGVQISTSQWTLTELDMPPGTAITKDNEGLMTGNRATSVRLAGGTVGHTWEITNRITTNELPIQTKERSFRILIEQL